MAASDSGSELAGQGGLEPPTRGFGIRCSTNWSYCPLVVQIRFAPDFTPAGAIWGAGTPWYPKGTTAFPVKLTGKAGLTR